MPTSGHGGKVIVGATDFHVTTWRTQHRARLAESTDSSTGGLERWNSIVTGCLVTLEFVWDSANIPDAATLAMDPGNSIVLVTWFGVLPVTSATKIYTFAAVLIETLEIVNDNVNDVIRGTITGLANGVITDPV